MGASSVVAMELNRNFLFYFFCFAMLLHFVVGPPTINEDVSPSSVICGKKILCLLNCHATSNHPVIYSWTKNGKMVADRYNVKVMNSTIAITPHDARDYGEYVCNVSSSFGSTSFLITVSECLESSIATERMKAAENMNNLLCRVIMGLSGAVILLIIVIITLVVRQRRTLRKKRVKTQIMCKAEERQRQQIRCDDLVSPRNNGNGLHPTSSEEQSGRLLKDGTSQKLKGNNQSTDVYETVDIDGAKQSEKEEKELEELESSYEAIEVKLSEPRNYTDPKDNPSDEQTYESIKEESAEHGYYNRRSNRKKLDKQGHGENLRCCDYDNLSCTAEKLELSTAGYYNRSSNRERLEKPGGHVYDEVDSRA